MSDVFLKHSDIDLPLVSIIILSYNHSSFIIRCLTSLANQSYHNIEVIIIDDCSKDDSVKLIKEFILLRPNFKCYVNDVNIGVTKNLNKAISEYINGKYLFLCASDDILEENAMKVLTTFLEINPQYEVCYGRVRYIDDKDNIGKEFRNDKISGDIFLEVITGRKCIPQQWLFRKSNIHSKIGLYDITIGVEDQFMFNQIAMNFKIGFIDEFIVRYRIHDGNTTKRHLYIYEESKKLLNFYVDKPFFDEILSEQRINWFLLLSANNKIKSLQYLKFALIKFYDKRVILGFINLLEISTLYKWLKKSTNKL